MALNYHFSHILIIFLISTQFLNYSGRLMTSTNLDNKKTKYEKLPNKKTFYLNDKNRQKQEKKIVV